jgi:hypothetical protein
MSLFPKMPISNPNPHNAMAETVKSQTTFICPKQQYQLLHKKRFKLIAKNVIIGRLQIT